MPLGFLEVFSHNKSVFWGNKYFADYHTIRIKILEVVQFIKHFRKTPRKKRALHGNKQ